jgi:CRISPR/Cas system-associated exonuclease Cas4 (RecB family)
MVKVPDSDNTTAKAILAWHGQKRESHRPHLGASLIGHDCDRHIWLTWRWVMTPEIEGRIRRLFGTGNLEEARIIDELKALGVELYEEDGKQVQCRDETGHFGGSVDGVGRGFPEAPKTWAVLECKTMSDSAWKSVSSKGVKSEKPQHYAQMQTYMGLLKLDRALYLAVNKNNDDLYSEWVHFDPDAFVKYKSRADRLMKMRQPPLKLSNEPTHFICKMCSHYELCHRGKTAEVNCRTCAHSVPLDNGTWGCDHKGIVISDEIQRVGCKEHLFIHDLVGGAKAFDGGINSTEYVEPSGKKFRNANGNSRKISKRKVITPEEMEANKEMYAPLNDDIPF